MALSKYLCFLLLLCVGTDSVVQPFYVSNIIGSDSNSGTSVQNPFKSISRAQSAAQDSQKHGHTPTVFVCGNSLSIPYFISQTLKFSKLDSGSTKQTPITWHGGCAGGKPGFGNPPIISAGIGVSNWTKLLEADDYIHWTAELPTSQLQNPGVQLWVNGQRQNRARLPLKHGSTFMWAGSVDPHNPLSSKNRKGMIVYSKDLPTNFKHLNDVVVIVFHSYDTSWVKIQSIKPVPESNGTQLELTFTNELALPLEQYKPDKTGKRYWLDNVVEGMTTPGRFYVDAHANNPRLNYLSAKGEDMNQMSSVLSNLQTLLSFDDAKYITFNNFIFSHTQWSCSFQGTDLCGSNDGAYYQPKQDAVTVQYSQGIQILYSNFTYMGQFGVWMKDQVSDSVVSNCGFYDMGTGGVRFDGHGCENNLFSQSHVQHISRVFPQGVGVRLEHSNNVTITRTTMHDLGGKGVVIHESNKTFVTHTHMWNLIQGVLSDKGFVQTSFGCYGSVIQQNLFHDMWGFDDDTNGLYLDQGSANTQWSQNVVYHAGEKGGVYQHWGSGNNIYNNIIVILPSPYTHDKDGGNGVCTQPPTGKPNSFSFHTNIVVLTNGSFWNKDVTLAHLKSVHVDNNLYYSMASGVKYTFPGGSSWKEWQEAGFDKNGIIGEDPKFVDFQAFNFSLQPSSPAITKLKFEPWDESDVGPTEHWGPLLQ